MPKSAFKRTKWEQIAFLDESSDKHEKIMEQFTSGMIKTEKLNSPDEFPRYAFRLNVQGRAIATSIKFEDQDCLVVLSIDLEHRYKKTSGMAKDAASVLDQALIAHFDPKSIKKSIPLGQNISAIETADGKIMVYSREQASAADSIDHVMDKATLNGIDYCVVNGLAGSGKTTIAYDVLSRAKGTAIYLTKSKGLVSSAKKALNNPEAQDREAIDESNIQCLSYEQLISKKLFEYFPKFVNKVLDDKKNAHYKDIKKAISLMEDTAPEDGDDGQILALQETLVRLHQEQAAHDIFSEDNNVMDLCLKAYFGETLCDKDGFMLWLTNRDTKNLLNALPKGMSPEDAYFEIQKSHMPLGKKSTLYKEFHETKGATNAPSQSKQLLKKYTDYLTSNFKIDPAFVKTKVEDEAKLRAKYKTAEAEDNVTILVIDEAQNFSPMEIETTVKEIDGKVVVYLCRDGNQSLLDPFDLIIHTMSNITGKEPLEICNLNTSYRTPDKITELVNILLKIKGQVIGGKLHKVDSTTSTSGTSSSAKEDDDKFTSTHDNNGCIKWIQSREDKSISALKDVSSNIINSIVVIFNEKDQAGAKKLFPDAMILYPHEIVGLEYENVILYNPFGHNSLLSNDKEFKLKYKASAPTPSFYPKDDKFFKYVKPFNELFVAMTRSTSNLYILDFDSSKSSKNAAGDNFFLQAFEAVLTENESAAFGKTENPSLKDVVNKIDEMKDTFQESVLIKHIEAACDIIKKDETSSDGASYPFLNILSTLMEYRHLNTKYPGLRKFIEEELEKRAPKKVEASATQLEALSSASPEKEGASSVHSELKPKILEKILKTIEQNDTDSLKKLIETFPDCVNFKNEKLKLSPLHFAAKDNKEDAIQILIDAGAQINAATQNGVTPLHTAVANGHLNAARILVNAGADINAVATNPGTKNLTPLDIARENGKQEMVEILEAVASTSPDLDAQKGKGASSRPSKQEKKPSSALEAKRQEGVSPIKQAKKQSSIPDAKQREISDNIVGALKENNVESLKITIAKHPECIDFKDSDGFTPLHAASKRCNAKIITSLLKAGAKINATDTKDGITPLHNAVANGNIDAITVLLDWEANIDAISDGKTPLHTAVRFNKLDALRILVNKGANTKIKNHDEKTPLDLALESSNQEMIEILASPPTEQAKKPSSPTDVQKGKGASPVQDKQETKPSFAGANKGTGSASIPIELKGKIAVKISEAIKQKDHQSLGKLITKYPECVDFIIDRVWSPLHFAIIHFNLDALEALIEAGANTAVFATFNGTNLTPLHIAVSNCNLNSLKALIKAGADVNVVSSHTDFEYKASPLHLAVNANDPKILKCLLKAKADIKAIDENGLTPLDFARKNGNQKMVQMLEAVVSTSPSTEIQQGRGSLPIATETEEEGLVFENKTKNEIFNNFESKMIKNSHKASIEEIPLHLQKLILIKISKAIDENDLPILTKLIAKYPDCVNWQNSEGLTPLHMARNNANQYIIKILESECNPDKQALLTSNNANELLRDLNAKAQFEIFQILSGCNVSKIELLTSNHMMGLLSIVKDKYEVFKILSACDPEKIALLISDNQTEFLKSLASQIIMYRSALLGRVETAVHFETLCKIKDTAQIEILRTLSKCNPDKIALLTSEPVWRLLGCVKDAPLIFKTLSECDNDKIPLLASNKAAIFLVNLEAKAQIETCKKLSECNPDKITLLTSDRAQMLSSYLKASNSTTVFQILSECDDSQILLLTSWQALRFISLIKDNSSTTVLQILSECGNSKIKVLISDQVQTLLLDAPDQASVFQTLFKCDSDQIALLISPELLELYKKGKTTIEALHQCSAVVIESIISARKEDEQVSLDKIHSIIENHTTFDDTKCTGENQEVTE